MKRTFWLISAFAIVAAASLVLLIGCPSPVETPMSIYTGTVYGATPYFNDVELSRSEAYHFKDSDRIIVRYTLTAKEGEEYAEHELPVGGLSQVGGLFKIVDYIRDPQSLIGYEVLSQGDRFAIIRVND